jgi:hypothetical protein
VLAATVAIPWDVSRASALAGLAPYLPPDLLIQAMSAATRITDAGSRARALISLVPRLPEPDRTAALNQAFTAAAAVIENGYRAQYLAELAPQLPADLLAQALAVTPRWTDRNISALDYTSRPTEPIVPLLARGESVLGGRDDEALVRLLRIGLDRVQRLTCLDILGNVSPMLARMGGTSVIGECAQAIEDVHRWWP